MLDCARRSGGEERRLSSPLTRLRVPRIDELHVIIRETQLEAFRHASEAAFAKSAADHMTQYDPVLATAAGRERLEHAAAKALHGARAHDLASDRNLQLYLELTMSFGSGFTNDPQYRWLKPYVDPRDDMSAVERARHLHFHSTAYMQRAYGEKNEFVRAAFERAHENLRRLATSARSIPAADLLHWLHPERVDFVDSEAATTLSNEASRLATSASLPLPQAVNVLLVLMFLFGHHIASDPLYPWVAESLMGAEEAPRQLESLVEAARKYLCAALTEMTKENA